MSKSNRRRSSSPKSAARRPQLDVAAFRGRWVAIDPETYKVVGAGASLEEARVSGEAAAKLEPILYFVPKSEAFFVGRAQ